MIDSMSAGEYYFAQVNKIRTSMKRFCYERIGNKVYEKEKCVIIFWNHLISCNEIYKLMIQRIEVYHNHW